MPKPAAHRRRKYADRPEVRQADPDHPGQCLCGAEAEYVVDATWFSGRRSLDPVCERHVAEVVEAIRRKQARRDGG